MSHGESRVLCTGVTAVCKHNPSNRGSTERGLGSALVLLLPVGRVLWEAMTWGRAVLSVKSRLLGPFPKARTQHTVPPTRRGSQPRGTVPSRQHTESPSGYSAWAWGCEGFRLPAALFPPGSRRFEPLPGLVTFPTRAERLDRNSWVWAFQPHSRCAGLRPLRRRPISLGASRRPPPQTGAP